jgi:ABC-type polysaccharide/polyol phosphate export permease
MHITFHISVIMLPLAIILLACFSLGVGLILSTMAVYFPDVAEMYQIILLAWFYLTPIIYPPEILPSNLQAIFSFNPMYYLVYLFRLPLINGIFPTVGEVLPAVICSVGVLILGWIFFTSKSDEFAYRI